MALSAKTDLKQFALKLYNNATLCTAEETDQIVAMVARYTENAINNVAFTSVDTLRGAVSIEQKYTVVSGQKIVVGDHT